MWKNLNPQSTSARMYYLNKRILKYVPTVTNQWYIQNNFV